MILNRRSFLSVTAIAATLTAAACSSDDSTTSGSSSGPTDAPSAQASGEPVVHDAAVDLVIWADQKKADSLTEFAKKWGEQQGITVTVQTVANDLQSNFITANQAGNGPDVVLGAHDWIGNLECTS